MGVSDIATRAVGFCVRNLSSESETRKSCYEKPFLSVFSRFVLPRQERPSSAGWARGKLQLREVGLMVEGHKAGHLGVV